MDCKDAKTLAQTMASYISKYRLIYKSLNPVYSTALKSTVYFTSEGFNHLLFKHGHRRPNKEIQYRLPLIKLIIPVIKNCTSISKAIIEKERKTSKSTIVYFYELSHIVGRKEPARVKVIVRKRGTQGKFHFLSVMKQKAPKKGAV